MAKNNNLPTRDANESTKAYRERLAKEKQEREQKEAFNRFVNEKREDYTLTALGALIQGASKADRSKVDENVGLAISYADVLLNRLFGVRRAPATPVKETSNVQPDAEPEQVPEAVPEEGTEPDGKSEE